MAEILSDKEIIKLFGSVISDADKRLLNPNGLELRLGKFVLFQSTDEEKELESGHFIKIKPGESITISSFEKLDFSRETVNRIYEGSMLMGYINPTTTMMREGISQVSTKIDAGFKGTLNWSLRNSSPRDIIIQYQEPIYKLTIYKLDGNEIPDQAYGERSKDYYQNTEGITRSKRQIPSQISLSKLHESNVHSIDPKKQLQEAGYPFNYIGTELVDLTDKVEDVAKETKNLSAKIDKTEESLVEKAKTIFNEQYTKIVGAIIAIITTIYAVGIF